MIIKLNFFITLRCLFKFRDMKKYAWLFAFLFFCSCTNVQKQETTIIGNDIDVPEGYTHKAFVKYIPENQIEKNFISDLKDFEVATNNLDYDKIVELYYPDYFVYLSKVLSINSLDETKKKFKEYLQENLENNNKRFTEHWDKAEKSGVYVTNIINRVKERDGILYLYEFHEVLYSKNDSIFEIEPTYGIAASLNNGKKWHSCSSTDDEELFEVLGYSFSKNSIEKVLSK